MIIHGGESFFMQGGSHGVLLIHGFTGVPGEMLLLAKHAVFEWDEEKDRVNYSKHGIHFKTAAKVFLDP